MNALEMELEAQLAGWRSEIAGLLAQHGASQVSSVSMAQLHGGLRGVIGVVCDTSEVDPQRGLIIRGLSLAELAPLGLDAADLFRLLLAGHKPTKQQSWFESDDELPGWFGPVLASLRDDTHPMAAMCIALQALQCESTFDLGYRSTPRIDYWRLALDDSVHILAVLPRVVGCVLRRDPAWRWDGSHWAKGLGEAAGLQALDGQENELRELMQLYILAHCDHEGSNACALACHVAGSAHADPYLALTAGWRALAGPIHGLAAQTCIEFIDTIMRELGDSPDADAVAALCQRRLDAGQVIPGFGHAVLRDRDPRYEMLAQFAREHFPDDPHFRVAETLGQVVPPLLMATGKVASPWPNVDGITGAVLRHYGLRDYRYLTVLFACAMSLGLLAQYVINRALGTPIMHPRGIAIAELKRRVGA